MIKNTSKSPNPEWLFGGNPDAIEKQEAKGQQELVNSEQLPTDIRDKEKLEKAGVEFGKPLDNDPVFCKAKLPLHSACYLNMAGSISARALS